jgi:Protein of unknown function (DUF3054)
VATGADSRPPPRLAAASDTAAILLFVTIGLLSHRRGLGPSGYARDALPFLGSWFVAALVCGLYARPGFWRLPSTWAIAVPAAVLVRALVLGRRFGGSEAAFLAVSLVTIGILVLGLRAALRLRLARRARS